MKKYLFFIQAAVMLAVSSVGLVSCGKDDVVHGGKTIVVYSVVGGWYKWLTSSTIIGWSNSPSWEDPGKWSVSGNVLTVKSQEEEVIFRCNFFVTEEGKSVIISNVQTTDEWQFLNNLEGELIRMQVKEDNTEE